METATTIPQLIKITDKSYKMNIPSSVEDKIKFICNQVSTVEWSGTLFYTYTGNFENGSLEINCVDLFVMDIGSAAYTEFDMSPDVISYMVEHDLLHCQMALIHSHNTMATFFSGTDTSTLKEEGNDRNHFVSLIVNNKGPYTAAITRKIKYFGTRNYNYEYNTFEDNKVSGEYTDNSSKEVIEWFNLDINIEEDKTNSYSELLTRLDALREKKSKSSIFSIKPTTEVQQYLPFDYSQKPSIQQTKIEETEVNYEDFPINTLITKASVDQLLTASLIVPSEKPIDTNKWAVGMVKLFDKRFGNSPLGFGNFKIWAESFIEFICTEVEDPDYGEIFTEDEMTACCAYYLKKALEKLPRNKYINFYIETVERYII